jgi:two-component system response regulator FixJ
MERTTLHIIGGDSRSRAEQARIAFALGHHAEVYADLDELLERPPFEGIVFAADEGEPGGTRELIRRLGASGLWLPVVMASSEPALERVVAAIKAGALDFLRLPLEMGSFARRLAGILAEADQHAERRRREVEAQRAISLLSRREREVLELLSAGCSNKEIARWLEISPRTVEIHRGNMMTKLGAGHAADAVRLWIDAELEIPALPPEEGAPPQDLEKGIAGRIGERRAGPRFAQGQRRQRQ